jgi:hypothetical protein
VWISLNASPENIFDGSSAARRREAKEIFSRKSPGSGEYVFRGYVPISRFTGTLDTIV